MAIGQWRGLIPSVLGIVAFGAVVAWFGIVKPQRQGDAQSSRAAASPQRQAGPASAEQAKMTQAPASSERPDPAREEVKAATQPAPAQPSIPTQATTPAKPAAPAEAEKAAEAGKADGPTFDVVRVEPGGDSVIAGRGAPGATIEMLRNGKSHARVLADTSGLFAFVAPPLVPGSHEIVLGSIAPDGTRAQSRDSVTVVINENRVTKPLVTLTSPDRPTVVLSAPEPSTPKTAMIETPDLPPSMPSPLAGGGGPQGPAPRPGVKIASVEAEEGGRLFVSGLAAVGATVRLYLNDTFVAPGGTGSDGKVSFAIGRGMRPGDYRVRLDDVDPVSGEVKSRAEVAFNVPAPMTVPLPPHVQPDLLVPDQPGTMVASRSEAAGSERSTASIAKVGKAIASRDVDPGTVVVPEINTAMVTRGDNLWRISRRIYGEGTRYTVIYDANQAQIRNPHRIYPGQVFVLPTGKAVQAR